VVPILLAVAGPAQAETVVLRDFTLIDGTGHAPEAHQALVMTNGRIAWMGPAASVKVPRVPKCKSCPVHICCPA
jgi:hypothetical protein